MQWGRGSAALGAWHRDEGLGLMKAWAIAIGGVAMKHCGRGLAMVVVIVYWGTAMWM